MIKKHTRPNPQQGDPGRHPRARGADPVANLKVICPECGKPTRIGRQRLDDGRGVRVCKNCGATFS